VEEYVDFSCRITGYALADLREIGNYDWRLSSGNVWKVERMLLDLPHRRLQTSDARIDRLRKRYRNIGRVTRKPVTPADGRWGNARGVQAMLNAEC
jgi:phosphatidylserine/phosphatidylglycerophosphate/cardiolipin synthase-like enzyme